MPEFMFFIRKQRNSEASLSAEVHEKFLKSCERYISSLKKDGKLISAQPIEWVGKIISSSGGSWKAQPFDELGEVIGGYYHIRANDLEEAVSLAKANPEFEYNRDTRIEVRAIKTKETTTGFVYPKKD